MQAVESAHAAQDEASAYRKAIRAFSDVAVALTDAQDQSALLHLVARKICELAGATRCSVYLRDEETGLYKGQVGHARKDIDADVQRLTAGIPADQFTHEIVATRRPVHIRDAQHDPRPIHSTMRHWGVRSMVGVPMVLRDEVIGIIYLDSEDAPRAFDDTHVEMAAVFAELAAVAVSQAQMTARLRESFGTVARQNDILRRVAALDDKLTSLVVQGAGVREIVQAVSDLTGKSCALYDSSNKRLAAAVPAGEDGFVIPRLLGGTDSLMIGRVLWDEYFLNRNWPVASAVAIALLLVLVIPIMIFQRSQAQETAGAHR